MNRRLLNILFIAAKPIGDLFIVVISLIAGYVFKFKLYLFNSIFFTNIKMVHPDADWDPYLPVILIYTLIMMMTLYFCDVYKEKYGVFAEIDEVGKVLKGVFIGVIEVMAFTFIYKEFPQSRFVLLYAGVFTVILMSIYHLVILELRKYLKKRGVTGKKMIIIGNDSMTISLAERIVKNHSLGYHIVGFVSDKPLEEIPYNLKEDYHYLGTVDKLQAHMEQNDIDEVIIAQSSYSKDQLEKWYFMALALKISFHAVPDYFDLISTSAGISEVDGIPLVSVKDIRLTAKQEILKRILDLLISIPMLIIFSPLMLLAVIMIKLESKGSVIYMQERAGKNRKPFMMYKFRSMGLDAEKSGPQVVSHGKDLRVTKVGRFLRKSSIDELPQLINVIKGDMSIVGPRPEREFYIKKYEEDVPEFSSRLAVKPGISGWAQINGRSALTNRVEEKLRYDLFYIENWSLSFDLKILIKTVFKVLFASQAY